MDGISIHLPKSKIEAFCKKHHIVYLALFGSILTSGFAKESDVDILVKFEKQHTPHLFDFAKMEFELTSILGREVDLNTPEDLNQYFRNEVLANAMPVYGK